MYAISVFNSDYEIPTDVNLEYRRLVTEALDALRVGQEGEAVNKVRQLLFSCLFCHVNKGLKAKGKPRSTFTSGFRRARSSAEVYYVYPTRAMPTVDKVTGDVELTQFHTIDVPYSKPLPIFPMLVLGNKTNLNDLGMLDYKFVCYVSEAIRESSVINSLRYYTGNDCFETLRDRDNAELKSRLFAVIFRELKSISEWTADVAYIQRFREHNLNIIFPATCIAEKRTSQAYYYNKTEYHSIGNMSPFVFLYTEGAVMQSVLGTYSCSLLDSGKTKSLSESIAICSHVGSCNIRTFFDNNICIVNSRMNYYCKDSIVSLNKHAIHADVMSLFTTTPNVTTTRDSHIITSTLESLSALSASKVSRDSYLRLWANLVPKAAVAVLSCKTLLYSGKDINEFRQPQN